MSSKTTNLDKMKEGFSRAATASRNKFSSIIEPGAEISTPHHKSPSKNRSTTHHSLFLTGEINRGGGGGGRDGGRDGGKDGGTSGRPRADSNGGREGEFQHHSSSSSIESIAECLKYLLDDESDLLSLALRKKLATPTTPRSASPRASCPPSSSSYSSSSTSTSPLLATGEDTSQFTAGALLANHANGFPLFYDFMESSFAEEHINFLADVGQFKRQMVEKAESIFNKYFKNSELSCDEFTKQEISQEIKTRSINVNLFSRASAEVLHLIVDLYYPRFAATEHYNHWKVNAKERVLEEARIEAKRLKKKKKATKEFKASQTGQGGSGGGGGGGNHTSLALVPGITITNSVSIPIGMQGELEVETTVQQQRHLLLSQIKDGTLPLQALKDSIDREIIQIHDTVDESKQTLLHLAASFSFSPTSSTPVGVGVAAGIGLGAGLTSANASILSFLLESKVNLNAKDERNWTPLHVACNASNLSAISLLLQASADVSAVNNEGVLPLHYLAKSDQYFTPPDVLFSSPSPLSIVSSASSPSLIPTSAPHFTSVGPTNTAAPSYLSSPSPSASASVSFSSSPPTTPSVSQVHPSASASCLSVPTSALPFGTTSLTTLHNILSPDLYSQYLQLMEKMILMGANANHQTAKSETPLHYACSSKRSKSDVIKLLAKFGSNGVVNIRSKRGHTPLHLAILVGCKENVKAMLDVGADPKIFGVKNTTALDMARGKPAITSLIVAHFASLRNQT